MAENTEVQIEDMEFQLESDSELRFEVENKNETVVLEVRILPLHFYSINNYFYLMRSFYLYKIEKTPTNSIFLFNKYIFNFYNLTNVL